MRRHPLAFGSTLVAICIAIALAADPAAALSTGNGGWQWQNPLPQGSSYTDGYFLDAAHGWLISDGIVYHTSDGGVTLNPQLRANVSFMAITFVGHEHGWAVGYPATASGTAIVYRTVNAGKTWHRVRLRWGGGIKDVSFATTEIGWATSGHAVLHTTDGGVHWTRHDFAPDVRPSGVQALGAERAWVAAGGNALQRTVDGGVSWTGFGTGAAKHVSVVCFTSVKDGWAGGGDGHLVHTTDGGVHWKVQLAGRAISALSFSDSHNGWATARGTVYRTTDGGADWAPAATSPLPYATWVLALTPPDAIVGNGWALPLLQSTGGGLSHTSDGGATWQQATTAADDYFGTLNGLQFVDAATGWAVGAGGEILATANGGATWAAQASTTTQDLHAVHFIDASTGWAVGDQGAVVHTTDGGATWAAQTSGVGDDLTGVTFTDAQNGWATGITYYAGSEGVTGVIINTSDGGRHWTTQATPVPDAGLSSVVFADPEHGWAVGEVQGDSTANVTVVLGTIDGGATWTRQLSYNPPETENTGDGVLNAVACTDADHAVAVGGGSGVSEIFRTVNGGATWTRLVKPAAWSVYLTDVVFVDASHGWAVGNDAAWIDRGTVIATTDGGATWTKLLAPGNLGSEPLDAVSFVSPTQGWVAGGGADILTTTTGGHTP